mmetsp:Transcript_14008/g.28022  ORF Transcript_14008/g.28022 Transcript_14008/m.28022 type:complete len:89 (-) Transcript_14008:103-369(-)
MSKQAILCSGDSGTFLAGLYQPASKRMHSTLYSYARSSITTSGESDFVFCCVSIQSEDPIAGSSLKRPASSMNLHLFPSLPVLFLPFS